MIFAKCEAGVCRINLTLPSPSQEREWGIAKVCYTDFSPTEARLVDRIFSSTSFVLGERMFLSRGIETSSPHLVIRGNKLVHYADVGLFGIRG